MTQANTQANHQVSNQALTEPNQDMGKLLSTNHNIMDGDKSVSIKLADFTITEDGKPITIIDVIHEAEAADPKIESLTNQIKRVSGEVGTHMIMIAQKAGNPDTFAMACKVAEESLHIGRAPGGCSPEERKLYSGSLPNTWKQYKSKIIAAMKAGVHPGKEYEVTQKLPRPNKAGDTEKQVKVQAVTIRKMQTIATDLKRKAEPKIERAGIEVKQDGEQVVHMPTNEQAEDIKTMAACIDVNLTELLGETLDLLSKADDDIVKGAIKTITNLNKRLKKSIKPKATKKAKAA